MLRTTCICAHCYICIWVQVQEPLFAWSNSIWGGSQVPNSQQVIECKRWNLSAPHPPTHWHLNIKILNSQACSKKSWFPILLLLENNNNINQKEVQIFLEANV